MQQQRDISLAEFAELRPISRKSTRAFQVHVKQHHGTFNFRSHDEWNRIYSEFLALDRTRRSSQ